MPLTPPPLPKRPIWHYLCVAFPIRFVLAVSFSTLAGGHMGLPHSSSAVARDWTLAESSYVTSRQKGEETWQLALASCLLVAAVPLPLELRKRLRGPFSHLFKSPVVDLFVFLPRVLSAFGSCHHLHVTLISLDHREEGVPTERKGKRWRTSG